MNHSPTPGPPTLRAEEDSNVDKIRDILFGTQMKDYDAKFSRLEARLQADGNELREDVKRRLASLEAFVKGEFGGLSERLKGGMDEQQLSLKAVAGELKEHIKGWEKKNQQMEAQNERSHRELREQLLIEAKRLGEEISQKTRELAAALARESGQLRESLTPRQQLAEILAQMALQLRPEASEKRER